VSLSTNGKVTVSVVSLGARCLSSLKLSKKQKLQIVLHMYLFNTSFELFKHCPCLVPKIFDLVLLPPPLNAILVGYSLRKRILLIYCLLPRCSIFSTIYVCWAYNSYTYTEQKHTNCMRILSIPY